MQVIVTQNLSLDTVMVRMGSGFNSGGGAGGYGLPSVRGAIAAWKPALDEIGRLADLN